MQYLAFWDEDVRRGIYYGLHDGAPASKFIHFSRKADGSEVTLKIAQPLEHIANGCNSQKLYGVCVWQAFDGDWFDAAMLYRAWALSEASWLPEIDENGRKKSPSGSKPTPTGGGRGWKTTGGGRVRTTTTPWPTRSCAPRLSSARQARCTSTTGIRSRSITTTRTTSPSRTSWQTPSKRSAMRTSESCPTSTAVCGTPRISRTRTGSSRRSPIRTARRTATESPSSRPTTPRRLTARRSSLSIMCPSTAVWQEKQREIVGRLFNGAGNGRGLHRPDRRGQGQPLRG